MKILIDVQICEESFSSILIKQPALCVVIKYNEITINIAKILSRDRKISSPKTWTSLSHGISRRCVDASLLMSLLLDLLVIVASYFVLVRLICFGGPFDAPAIRTPYMLKSAPLLDLQCPNVLNKTNDKEYWLSYGRRIGQLRTNQAVSYYKGPIIHHAMFIQLLWVMLWWYCILIWFNPIELKKYFDSHVTNAKTHGCVQN